MSATTKILVVGDGSCAKILADENEPARFLAGSRGGQTFKFLKVWP